MAFNKKSGLYEGFIYLIENTINGHKYVGQTLQTIEQRWKQHEYDSKRFDYPLYKGIRKYGIENFVISQIETFKSDNKNNLSHIADEREIYWINYYDTYKNGYNQTIGGQNNAPNKFPERPINEYSLQGELLNTYKSIADASDSTGFPKSSISSCALRKKINRVKNKIFRFVDEPLTTEEKDFYIKKYPIIYQYDFNGNLLNTFEFIQDAVDYLYTNGIVINKTNISICCSGKTTTAGGYVWRKYPNNFDTYQIPRYYKKIEKRDISTGQVLETFSSFDEILNRYEYSRIKINNCCNNHRPSAYGYHWCYEGEFNIKNLKRINLKPVVQYSTYGNMIQTFNSASDAASSLGIKNSRASGFILSVCNGKNNTAYGFVWRYLGDDFNKYNNIIKTVKEAS